MADILFRPRWVNILGVFTEHDIILSTMEIIPFSQIIWLTLHHIWSESRGHNQKLMTFFNLLLTNWSTGRLHISERWPNFTYPSCSITHILVCPACENLLIYSHNSNKNTTESKLLTGYYNLHEGVMTKNISQKICSRFKQLTDDGTSMYATLMICGPQSVSMGHMSLVLNSLTIRIIYRMFTTYTCSSIKI